MDVFVARHAILDRDLKLFGYELLFRSCNREGPGGGQDDTKTTLQMLANSLLSCGLQGISCNAPVFINFGRELLTSDWTSIFPPKSVVIEILESVQPDSEVVVACLALKKMGYMLALDDVIGSPRDGMLAHLADFVKVDFRATSREEQLSLAHALKRVGKKIIAEKVETHDEFQFAIEAGYELFQGFFFAKPTLLRGRHIPNGKLNAMRLLKELQCPDLDLLKIEEMVKCDVALSYRLFRYVNSALFSRRLEITSIRHALMVLGDIGIRRFLTLATLPGLGSGTARELISHALVRAHFCEVLAEQVKPGNAQDAFLIGLFSLLDALVDRPLAEVLPELSLPKHIASAMLDKGEESTLARIYRASLAYETGDWKQLQAELAVFSLAHKATTDAYLDSIAWSADRCQEIGLPSEAGVDGLQSLGIEASTMESLVAMEKALTGLQVKVESEVPAGTRR